MHTLDFRSPQGFTVLSGAADFASSGASISGVTKIPLHGGDGNAHTYTAPNGVTVTCSLASVMSPDDRRFVLGNLFDGASPQASTFWEETYWRVVHISGSCTLTFDFQSLAGATISRILVYPRVRDDQSSNYFIEVSSDGVAWTSVVSTVDNTASTYTTVRRHDVSITQRFVRFSLTRQSTDFVLGEIEFYTPNTLNTMLTVPLPAMSASNLTALLPDSARFVYAPHPMTWTFNTPWVSFSNGNRDIAFNSIDQRAGSAMLIPLGADGFVEFSDITNDTILGFSATHDNTATAYLVDIGMFASAYSMRQNGSTLTTVTPITTNHLRIQVNRGVYHFYRNGDLLASATTAPTTALHVMSRNFATTSRLVRGIEGRAFPTTSQTGTLLSPVYGIATREALSAIRVRFERNTPTFSEDITPSVMNSPTPPYTVSASSQQSSSAVVAFDHRSVSGWHTPSGTTTGWLQFGFGSPTVVTRYVVRGGTVQTNLPRNWTFEGSNDGVAWTTLDSQANITWVQNNESKPFNIANTTPFSHYRINVTANNGGTLLQIVQLEMMRPIVTSATLEANVSFDGGQTWRGWEEITHDNQALQGIDLTTDLSNARIQFRATLFTEHYRTTPTIRNIYLQTESGNYAAILSRNLPVRALGTIAFNAQQTEPQGTLVRYLVSIDGGVVWRTFQSTWQTTALVDAFVQGMTATQVAALTLDQWLQLTGGSSQQITLAACLSSTTLGQSSTVTTVGFSVFSLAALGNHVSGNQEATTGIVSLPTFTTGTAPLTEFIASPPSQHTSGSQQTAPSIIAMPTFLVAPLSISNWVGELYGKDGETIVFRPRHLPNNWHPAIWNGQKENDQPLIDV